MIRNLINKSRKWFNSAAGKISIGLTMVSIVMIVIGWSSWGNLSSKDANNINNILFGLSTNLIGIIVTVSFVQYFLDKQAVKNEKIEEYKKIIRYNKYAEVLITEFTVYFNSVVTPMEKRSQVSSEKFVNDFSLTDMSDLYESTIFISDRIYTPVIEKFYEKEEKLYQYFLNMVENIDFKYSNELYTVIIGFLKDSAVLDVRSNIIGSQKLLSGGKKFKDDIVKEMKNPLKDYIKEYAQGKLNSHMMTPYVRLYFFLLTEKDYIVQYKEIIEKIEGELIHE